MTYVASLPAYFKMILLPPVSRVITTGRTTVYQFEPTWVVFKQVISQWNVLSIALLTIQELRNVIDMAYSQSIVNM